MSQAATRATTLVIRRDVSTSPLSCTRVCHVWCQCHAGDAAYAIWADGCTPIDVPDLLSRRCERDRHAKRQLMRGRCIVGSTVVVLVCTPRPHAEAQQSALSRSHKRIHVHSAIARWHTARHPAVLRLRDLPLDGAVPLHCHDSTTASKPTHEHPTCVLDASCPIDAQPASSC